MGRYKGKYDPRLLLLLIVGEDDDDTTIAERLGVNRQQVYRWRRGEVMLNTWAADRLAIKCGYHPALVWGQQWWDDAAPKRRLYRKGAK